MSDLYCMCNGKYLEMRDYDKAEHTFADFIEYECPDCGNKVRKQLYIDEEYM